MPALVRRAGPPLAPLHRYREILVVMLDRIGDWVLCTPFLRRLRAHTAARITVLVSEAVAPLATRCPFVDCVAVSSVARDGAFDLALVPRWDIDFNGACAAAAASGAPAVVGFAKHAAAATRGLTDDTAQFLTHVVVSEGVVHEADRLSSLLSAFAVPFRAAAPSVHWWPEDAREADALLRSFSVERGPLIGLAPFASEPKRSVPCDTAAALATAIVRRHRANILIFGGPEDTAAAALIAAKIGEGAAAVAGRVRLPTCAALLGRCTAVVAADSGPAHLAAVAGANVVVLSCHPAGGDPLHHNAPARFAPRSASGEVVVLQPRQTDCTGSCTATTPHCIRRIAHADVLAAVDAIMDETPACLRRSS